MSSYADSPAQWFLTVAASAAIIIAAWIARTLVKQGVLLDRLTRAIFPEEKPSLPDQVESIKDSVDLVRIRGSDRLQDLLQEARLQRIEAAASMAQLITQTRAVAENTREVAERLPHNPPDGSG